MTDALPNPEVKRIVDTAIMAIDKAHAAWTAIEAAE
jgi:hypothetical protein